LSSAAPAATPAASTVEMNELLLPQHANALGTAFGGAIMSWIDICAAMAAQRHARATVVTASMDQLDFIAAVQTGHLVNLKARVNFVGRTSMEVGVRVESEDPRVGDRTHTASSYLTFVALDDAGRPQVVRPLILESAADRLRWEEAKARRAKRLELAAERSSLAAAHG
jgi:acyl-CoA hydrolase